MVAYLFHEVYIAGVAHSILFDFSFFMDCFEYNGRYCIIYFGKVLNQIENAFLKLRLSQDFCADVVIEGY